MTTRSRYSGGTLAFYDSANYETAARFAPLVFYDDFTGANASLAIPTTATAGNNWSKTIVGAAPPTAGPVTNGVGGQMQCALTAASQAQEAMVFAGDALHYDVTKGMVFEARFQLTVLPSVAAVQAIVGMSSAHNSVPDSTSYYLQAGATGSGALLIRGQDGVTTTSAAAGVTVLTTTWVVVRIDATEVTDVKYYINGAKVTTTGQVNFVATGANAVMQPMFGLYKASGTGVGTLTVDYVKIWANRA